MTGMLLVLFNHDHFSVWDKRMRILSVCLVCEFSVSLAHLVCMLFLWYLADSTYVPGT